MFVTGTQNTKYKIFVAYISIVLVSNSINIFAQWMSMALKQKRVRKPNANAQTIIDINELVAVIEEPTCLSKHLIWML